MPRSRIVLVLWSLLALAGCATSSTASRREPPPEVPEAAPQAEKVPAPEPTPEPERKAPAVAAPRPSPKAPEPVAEPAPAPAVSDAQVEFFCGQNGALERRPASERPSGVVAFSADMRRPEKLSGPRLFWPQAALDQRVQGQVLARCILTRDGSVRSCRILKPLPPMDEEVLLSLCGSHYQPAMDQGQPVDVEYTFNIRVTPP
jgi:protein TonB